MLLGWAIDSKIHGQKRYRAIAVGFLVCVLAIACEDTRISQCEQIFQIARNVTQSDRDFDYANNNKITDKQSWLKAASRLALAADNISSLEISQSQLIQYQNQLAAVYRIYSQATYDAVKARENNNLEKLETAHADALKAGTIQRNLIDEINVYCLKP